MCRKEVNQSFSQSSIRKFSLFNLTTVTTAKWIRSGLTSIKINIGTVPQILVLCTHDKYGIYISRCMDPGIVLRACLLRQSHASLESWNGFSFHKLFTRRSDIAALEQPHLPYTYTFNWLNDCLVFVSLGICFWFHVYLCDSDFWGTLNYYVSSVAMAIPSVLCPFVTFTRCAKTTIATAVINIKCKFDSDGDW